MAHIQSSKFKYHDNHLTFTSSVANVYLQPGTFTVSNFKITDNPNQDPDKHNKPGDIHSLTNFPNDNNYFSFSVGRHASSGVADFWIKNIDSNQNTFNHAPTELNFAFIGTLVLTAQDPNNYNSSVTGTFKDIGLAQGSPSAGSSNWWFGGKNCTFLSCNTVRAKGTDQSGGIVYFDFERGVINTPDDMVNIKRIHWDSEVLEIPTSLVSRSSAFKYWDNQVFFVLDGGSKGSVQPGTFIVSDFSITEGQDPDTHNKIGAVHKITRFPDTNEYFEFSAGRKASSNVADFWIKNVNNDQNTFNRAPSELNFAFIGTLVLTAPDPSDANATISGTFENIALAQGGMSATGLHSWWLGGKNCAFLSNNTVRTAGTDKSGQIIYLDLQRGGNRDDFVDIKRIYWDIHA